MFSVWSRWWLSICVPWSVIRFRWSPSTNCPVIAQGENCNFNIGGFDRGNHSLSDYPDQWSDFSDHLIQIVQRSSKGKISSFNIAGYDRGITDHLTTLISDHLVQIVQWSGKGKNASFNIGRYADQWSSFSDHIYTLPTLVAFLLNV